MIKKGLAAMERVFGIRFSTPMAWYEGLAFLGGVLFFAQLVNQAVFVRLFQWGGLENSIAVLAASFVPLFLLMPLAIVERRMTGWFLLVYALIGLYFLISIWLHPNDRLFYFLPRHGIDRVFRPDGGLFALLFLWVLRKWERVDPVMKATALALFVLLLFQFVSAKMRGYWPIEGHLGEMRKLQYSLQFGFSMAFTVSLMAYCALVDKKKIYWGLAAVGYVMILMAGNRMALVLPLLFLLFFFFYARLNRCHSAKEYQKFLLQVLLSAAILVALYFLLVVLLSFIAKNINPGILKSRNLRMIINGDFFFDNGRNSIHSWLWEGLNEHPILGLGAFGDRIYIGRHIIWGHPHSFFLEFWSNFGVILGTPLALLLLDTVVSMFAKKDNKWMGLFLVFLSTSVLHLTSLSFWYAPYLWALMGLGALALRAKDRILWNALCDNILVRRVRKQ
ncbi:hypothetical protein ABB02_00835 [Clostridiaceae bacterium JG1575]|nr:hypothetical protein ABB02_00835 [Clostridiaceae bacterium JG1575]